LREVAFSKENPTPGEVPTEHATLPRARSRSPAEPTRVQRSVSEHLVSSNCALCRISALADRGNSKACFLNSESTLEAPATPRP
jgi:hypothetical protein